jgi:HEXXH motif-containing protein
MSGTPTLNTRSTMVATAADYPDALLREYCRKLDGAVATVLPRLLERVGAEAAARAEPAVRIYTALPDEARHDIVHHPYFSSLWTRMRRAVAERSTGTLGSHLGDLGRFIAVPAARLSYLDEPLVLRLDSAGDLRFPGHLTHVSLGPNYARADVTARPDAGGLLVSLDDQKIWMPAEPVPAAMVEPPLVVRAASADGRIEIDGTEPVVHRFYERQNAREPITGYARRDLEPFSDLSTDILGYFNRAIAVLDRFAPEFGAELRSYVRVVVPFRSRQLSTFTDTGFFGAVFLSQRLAPFADTLLTAEHLLHEASHLRFTLLVDADPIIASTTDAMVTSPWRRDPRPMEQILHGTFVFVRIVELLRAAMTADPDAAYQRRHDEVMVQLRQALETLTGPGTTFTPAGRQLVDRFIAVAKA